METVLITGASGFTGKHLSAILIEAGYKVVGLSECQASKNYLYCNLVDKSQVENVITKIKPDFIIHLAAISFVGHDYPEDFYNVNVIGTLNLLDALAGLEKKPSKVIVASSANVYGVPNKEIIDERTWPQPVNHYAASKLAMEHMVRTYFQVLPIIITRPFNYTGLGQAEQFLIPKIVAHFKRKEKTIELGNINVSRDFSDVRDIVKAYFLLLKSDVDSVEVNLCSGKALALAEVIQETSLLTDHEIEIIVNPQFVRQNEIPSLMGDKSKLDKLIGKRKLYSIQETLRWMLYGS